MFVLLAFVVLLIASLFMAEKFGRANDYYEYDDFQVYREAMREKRERQAREMWTYGRFRY